MTSQDILREARRRAGLTQAELGRRVGRPQSAIARWERGDVVPSFETLRRLVRGCDLELVFELATYDDSYVPHIERMLRLSPGERLRHATETAGVLQSLRPRVQAARRG